MSAFTVSSQTPHPIISPMIGQSPQNSRIGHLSRSRIVTTNRSDIVTIVIDDDDDDKPKAQTVGTSVTRLPMAVNTPMAVSTPKFVRSDNAVIVRTVNSANSYGQSSSGMHEACSGTVPRVMPGSGPRIVPRNNTLRFASHTPCHVEKTQSHYVVIKKNNILEKSLKGQSSVPTSTMGSTQLRASQLRNDLPNHTPHTVSASASASASVSSPKSPTRYRLWTQTKSTHNSRHSLLRDVNRDHLLPEDTDTDCMDDATFFKHLNLVPKKVADSKTMEELSTNWPLRNIWKRDKPKTSKRGNIIIPQLRNMSLEMEIIQKVQRCKELKQKWHNEANEYNVQLNRFKLNMPVDVKLKTQIHSQLECLHNRLMNDRRDHNQLEQEINKLKFLEQKRKVNDDHQLIDDLLKELEFSSPLGFRVRESLDDNEIEYSPKKIYKLILEYEKKCTPPMFIPDAGFSLAPSSAGSLKSSTTRITRSNTGASGVLKMWGPRNFSHEYCFTREQRLEKYRRLETGLNWKSRILLMQCKRMKIMVERTVRCPCCLEVVEANYGHSCHDPDKMIDDKSSDSNGDLNDEKICHSGNECNKSDEIIVAGDVLCSKCQFDDCDCYSFSVRQGNDKSIAAPVLVFTKEESDANKLKGKENKLRLDDTIVVQSTSSTCGVNRVKNINNKQSLVTYEHPQLKRKHDDCGDIAIKDKIIVQSSGIGNRSKMVTRQDIKRNVEPAKGIRSAQTSVNDSQISFTHDHGSLITNSHSQTNSSFGSIETNEMSNPNDDDNRDDENRDNSAKNNDSDDDIVIVQEVRHEPRSHIPHTNLMAPQMKFVHNSVIIRSFPSVASPPPSSSSSSVNASPFKNNHLVSTRTPTNGGRIPTEVIVMRK